MLEVYADNSLSGYLMVYLNRSRALHNLNKWVAQQHTYAKGCRLMQSLEHYIPDGVFSSRPPYHPCN